MIKKVKGLRLIFVCICLLLNFFLLISNSSAQILTANAGGNTSVCLNDPVQIGGKPAATGGTPPYKYSWQPASGLDVSSAANPKAFPSSQTNYTLTVTDGAGNSSSSAVTVSVLPLPTISVGADQTIQQGTSTTLQASGAANYVWFPARNLINQNTATPVAEPGSSTTYCAATVGANGCINFACMTLKVTPSDTIIMYNAFSPNGDAVNDVLYIGNLENFPNNKVEVFNRNGKLVYQASPYLNNWDGKVDGAELPCATYYIVFYPGNGRKKVLAAVTLIR